ncbi:MAG: hypothetical protein SangKO_083420 [Sandaracinaceae bacterium]
MPMTPVVSRLAAGAAVEAVSLINRVFVASRARSGHIVDRYPHVFGPESDSVVLAGVDAGRTVGAVVVRPVESINSVTGVRLRGGMVGFVCTAEGRRGEGISTALLAAARVHMRESGMQFGVLWTTIQSFYERIGWRAVDHSQLGLRSGPRSCQEEGETQPGIQVPAREADAEWLERLRLEWCRDRVPRAAVDYRVVPPAADDVLCVADQQGEGYALVGVAPSRAFLYELVGSPTCFPRLWPTVASLRGELMVNTHPGQCSYSYLRGLDGIIWSAQHQAMWVSDGGVDPAILDRLYFSFADRI